MFQPEEALEKILARVQPLGSCDVPIVEAVDRFAARDLFARFSLPLFDNSAMDGYAVVAGSCTRGARLPVAGEQPAGIDRQLSIRPGEAVRIFTGAPIPAGADAVIMQEDVAADGAEIIVGEPVAPGEFIRRRGGDVSEGQKILIAGDRISPQTVALLAAQGFGSVEVGRAPRVTIVSTGDELARPGATLEAGQVYEANSTLLEALLRKCGVETIAIIQSADRAEEIEAALQAGATNDVMIITGGVSVGARDLVKPALAAIGATLDLWRVAVKPGKPFLSGHTGDCAIFGLPGNPVSAFVTFLLFVRPAILKLMGANDGELPLPATTAELTRALHNPADRQHYLRGSLRGGLFQPMGRQESHALFGLSRSNALCLVRPGERFEAGSPVTVFTWE